MDDNRLRDRAARRVLEAIDRGDDGPLNDLGAAAREALDRASDAKRERFTRDACRVMLRSPRYRWRATTMLRALQPPRHNQRHRRASHGGKTVRCASRRVTAGARAGPDDEGELPGDIAPPLPIGGRQ